MGNYIQILNQVGILWDSFQGSIMQFWHVWAHMVLIFVKSPIHQGKLWIVSGNIPRSQPSSKACREVLISDAFQVPQWNGLRIWVQELTSFHFNLIFFQQIVVARFYKISDLRMPLFLNSDTSSNTLIIRLSREVS